jgi:SAM-dependent methyltransferase
VNLDRFRKLLFLSSLFLFLTAGAVGAQPAREYEPEVGQGGKDVVWVPTAQTLVEKMLDVAKVAADDYVIDLGSGDGRLVIAAAKRGARALGIEYNLDMVELSRQNAAKEGVSDKAAFIKADLFESDFSQATVITMFLLPDLNMRLRPKILDLKPGTRIVSNSFSMGAWSADQIVTADAGCNSFCAAYFWIVPAKVEGKWQLAQGELTLVQSFQMISGTFRSGEKAMQIRDGRLEGNQISFSVGDSEYTGRVNGNLMAGSTSSGESWKANRAGN